MGSCWLLLISSVSPGGHFGFCGLARGYHYRCTSDSQELLLSKPPHETLFIDGKEQVEASFQFLRPVDDA